MNHLDDLLSFLSDLFYSLWEFTSSRKFLLHAAIALLVFTIVMCYLFV